MRIEAPPGEETRPILDRAKTVLFDMLGARLAEPGRLPAIAVLDLFAGSGSLGLEAVSRGAAFAALIERNHAAARVIRRNLDALRIVDEARVYEHDTTVRGLPEPPRRCGLYELVFMDPPYRLLASPTPDATIQRLLDRIAYDSLIAQSAMIVVRHALQSGAEPNLAPLVELERREVGTMVLLFLRRPAMQADQEGHEPRESPDITSVE